MNIYISNLSVSVTGEMLRAAFSLYGIVSSYRIIKNPTTGVSRGFGFVEMADDAEGETAIHKMNGSLLDDRKILVKKANERPAPKGTLMERLRGY